jgi:hypothetical protein
MIGAAVAGRGSSYGHPVTASRYNDAWLASGVEAGVPYRVYVRWRDQSVSEKKTLEDEQHARELFEAIKTRKDLWGRQCEVVLSKDGRRLAQFRFNELERPLFGDR